jgi:hypothetical protein
MKDEEIDSCTSYVSAFFLIDSIFSLSAAKAPHAFATRNDTGFAGGIDGAMMAYSTVVYCARRALVSVRQQLRFKVTKRGMQKKEGARRALIAPSGGEVSESAGARSCGCLYW